MKTKPKNKTRVPRFWETKTLDEMSREEWESICDGCARCCLTKLQDEENGEVFYTSVCCELLDSYECRCMDYDIRNTKAPDCIVLTPQNIQNIEWLPKTCAYRLLLSGKKLKWWHPLVSGDHDSVHRAGISIRGKALSAKFADMEQLEAYILNIKI